MTIIKIIIFASKNIQNIQNIGHMNNTDQVIQPPKEKTSDKINKIEELIKEIKNWPEEQMQENIIKCQNIVKEIDDLKYGDWPKLYHEFLFKTQILLYLKQNNQYIKNEKKAQLIHEFQFFLQELEKNNNNEQKYIQYINNIQRKTNEIKTQILPNNLDLTPMNKMNQIYIYVILLFFSIPEKIEDHMITLNSGRKNLQHHQRSLDRRYRNIQLKLQYIQIIDKANINLIKKIQENLKINSSIENDMQHMFCNITQNIEQKAQKINNNIKLNPNDNFYTYQTAKDDNHNINHQIPFYSESPNDTSDEDGNLQQQGNTTTIQKQTYYQEQQLNQQQQFSQKQCGYKKFSEQDNIWHNLEHCNEKQKNSIKFQQKHQKIIHLCDNKNNHQQYPIQKKIKQYEKEKQNKNFNNPNSRILNLENALLKQQLENHELQKQNHELQKENQELQKENHELQNQQIEQEKINIENKKLNEEFLRYTEELENENQTLQNKNQTLQNKNQKLQDQNTQFNYQIDQYQKNTAEIKKLLNKTN